MRRAAKVDANHQEICKILRDIGASIISLASIGKNCPDLLVGFRGRNYLLEVKDGTKSPSKDLSDGQRVFLNNWRGHVSIVRSVADAIDVVTACRH